jgi:hypothetical protein
MGLQKYSEQMILDCNSLGYECNGGWPDKVMSDWLIPDQIKPVLATDYPYIAKKNSSCDSKAPRVNTTQESFIEITRYEGSAWTSACNRGPYITFIDGS